MQSNRIKPNQLVLRCYAERKDGQWQAFCLDFDLASQADSFKDAKKKLEVQIAEYVYDALVGEDRDHSAQLLSRRAPISQWAKYYLYVALCKLNKLFSGDGNGPHKPFREPVPLKPA